MVASEINAAYYGIERSGNGTDFTESGRVDASEQTNLSKNYFFSDNKAPAGILYYRLKMVGKDGDFSYSPIQKIILNCSGNSHVSIYPSPAKGSINIRLVAGYEKAKIRIFNTLGQQVASNATNNLNRYLNLKGLASGTYMVQVINNNQMTDNVKFVLTK